MVNKRAISDLIATVLLVLITIAAVGIIWGAVMPIIRTNIESSQKCFDVGLEIKAGGYTCYDGGVNKVKVQIGKGEKPIAISDIQIQLSSGGTSKSIRISNATVVDINTVPGVNEETAYTINLYQLNMDYADAVSVAAVLKIGNTESMCPAIPAVHLGLCA